MRALRTDSPRRIHAQRFGKLLRATLTARGIGEKRIVALVGGGRSSLRQYLAGYNLPRLDYARKLAEALDEPRLVTLCREGRTRHCFTCDKPYVDERGSPSKFCSERCHKIADKKRYGHGGDRVLDAAVAEAQIEVLDAQMHGYHVAITNMCRSCEPEGTCHDQRCPLRPVSPLPLAGKPVGVATPAAGPYGSPENRARTLAAIRANAVKRWTPEARAAWVEKVKEMHRDGTIPHGPRTAKS